MATTVLETAFHSSNGSNGNQNSLNIVRSQPSNHARRLCCFAQGVTCAIVFKVFFDAFITVGDAAFDIYISQTFFRSFHRKWGAVSIVVILLPGITCTFAQFIQYNLSSHGEHTSWYRNISLKGCGKVLLTLFFYPLWVLILGYQALTQIPDPKMMVHVKAWEGLMESSWMFLIQLVVFQCRPPIGHGMLFGVVHVPYGSFWFRVAGIVLSFCCFLYTVTEYHILLDGEISQPRRQLMLAPFFTINFLFRCLTLSLFWVYWKEPTAVVCIFLYLTNMWITKLALRPKITDRTNQQLTFCCIAGGIISQLTPALALFYGQTANKKTINYFYKKNIRINNFLLLVIFTGLVLHLNLDPDNHSLLNRNTFLGCHNTDLSYTRDEFGIYFDNLFREVNSTTSSMTFFGKNWTVRAATSAECTRNFTDEYRSQYLVAADCQPDQSPVEMFNMVAVPVIYTLGIISILTSFSTFDMR
eukprot:GFUD01026589.1.p1 GENE.GFUD01026589.1~~GFUD01026589.1.p1  ORF type:complete len:471 (-),score=67.33 GFUD01026589.1:800-2212(-)